jgi:hypothetical protein
MKDNEKSYDISNDTIFISWIMIFYILLMDIRNAWFCAFLEVIYALMNSTLINSDYFWTETVRASPGVDKLNYLKVYAI